MLSYAVMGNARVFGNLNSRVWLSSFLPQIKPLEESRAIADGGDLLAEGFIYGLGTFLSESSFQFAASWGVYFLQWLAFCRWTSAGSGTIPDESCPALGDF